MSSCVLEENNPDRIEMDVKEVYAHLKDNDKKVLATYQRQNLQSIKCLFASFQSGEAKIVSLLNARKPEYL